MTEKPKPRTLAPESRIAKIARIARDQPDEWRRYFCGTLAGAANPVELAERGLAERRAMLKAAGHLVMLDAEDRDTAVAMVQRLLPPAKDRVE
jgi:hypothetical protein